jgi:hypothetical protein
MTVRSVSVEEWKRANAHRIVECRWGSRITREACQSYQSRTGRYVFHFNGDHQPLCRPNADYVSCFFPEPCPHLLSDEEALHLRERNPDCGREPHERRCRQFEARRRHRLVDPGSMLDEEDSHRSLVTQ